MNADGSSPAMVGPGNSVANGPHWSADSAAIVYNTLAANDGMELWRLNPRDGSRHLLLQTPAYLTRVGVTPDEREIVYDAGRPRNIWSRPVHGGMARQLTFDREGASYPFLSWDGKWIVYELSRASGMQMAVMGLDGSGQQALTGEPGQHFPHSWASDNRRIAYAWFHDGVWNLYWMDRITRERKQVTHYTAFGSFVRSQAWRPGTERMVYEYSEVRGNVYALNLPSAGP